ncbi:unnamed protein product [Cunninghamella echinulata]
MTSPINTFDQSTMYHQQMMSPEYYSPPLSWEMNMFHDEPTSPTTPTTNISHNKKLHKRSISTFISKLYAMVGDPKTNQLISWNPSGTSFLVCNATLFSQEVLPIHFKHCNFSSFVRQLNMYGFHKINKSPRGQRGCNENEIWEFSHKHFQYGRPDSLIDIKRKAMDSELLRRETGDIHTSFAMVQLSQADLLQQFHTLQDNYSNLLTQFEEMKKTQLQQQIILRQLLENKQQQRQQPSSSSLSVSSATSTILPSQSPQLLPQQLHHQHQHQQQQQQQLMYTNAINPIMSNLASPTDNVFQFLPPSPSHSDNKLHSRSNSLESYSV